MRIFGRIFANLSELFNGFGCFEALWVSRKVTMTTLSAPDIVLRIYCRGPVKTCGTGNLSLKVTGNVPVAVRNNCSFLRNN